MADDGMDPCECIWSHEMAMRRLLSFLRQSQSQCTDSECIEQFPTLPGQQNGNETAALTMMIWFAVAVFLFMIRPKSLRASPDSKPHDNNNGAGSSGSPPPPMAN